MCKNRKMLERRIWKGRQEWGTVLARPTAIVAAIAAIGSLCFRNSHITIPRSSAMQAAEYIFVICASLTLFALYAGFAGRWRLHRFLESPLLIYLSAALLAVGVYRLGMHQFGGWDEGLLVHAGTYYAQGFKPYLDFPCPTPPLFMAGIRGGVQFLGLKWTSFTLIAASFTAFTALWIYSLLRLVGVARHWALVITVCAELSTMAVTPFWWFNNSSALSVVLLFLSVLACSHRPTRLLPWISLSFSLAMVVASKPNDLPATLMVLALLATKDRWQWTKIITACAGAAGCFLLLCYAAQMPPLGLLHTYEEIGKLRGSPLQMLPFLEMAQPEREFQIFFVLLTLLGFAALLVISARRQPSRWPLLVVCAIAGLTSLEMACTNSESKTSDLCVVMVAAAFLCLRPWVAQQVSARRRTALAGLLSVFLVMAGFFSLIHLRTLCIGERMFYEPLPTEPIRSGFFAGLEAGPRLQRVLAQSAEVFSRFPSQKVFFGPRMEFEYAAFDKPVTPKMPLLWDAGNLFSPEHIPDLLLDFQHSDPDLLIFLKDDYSRMGPVGYYIKRTNTYQRIDDFSELTVYLRRREIPLTYVRLRVPSLPQATK